MSDFADWARLADAAVAALSKAERDEAIVYLEARVVPSGSPALELNGDPSFSEPVALAFADLQPALNWTHHARWIVLGLDGRVIQTAETDCPPFLTDVPAYLRLVHRGPAAPDWAAVTNRGISD